jgi:hypothetical protein
MKGVAETPPLFAVSISRNNNVPALNAQRASRTFAVDR